MGIFPSNFLSECSHDQFHLIFWPYTSPKHAKTFRNVLPSKSLNAWKKIELFQHLLIEECLQTNLKIQTTSGNTKMFWWFSKEPQMLGCSVFENVTRKLESSLVIHSVNQNWNIEGRSYPCCNFERFDKRYLPIWMARDDSSFRWHFQKHFPPTSVALLKTIKIF